MDDSIFESPYKSFGAGVIIAGSSGHKFVDRLVDRVPLRGVADVVVAARGAGGLPDPHRPGTAHRVSGQRSGSRRAQPQRWKTSGCATGA
jgi:hypothetical protein